MKAVYTCACVPSYSRAEQHFNSTAPIAARNSNTVWTADTRPLLKGKRRSSYPQFRLIKHDNAHGKYFDVVLYNTIIGRHYEPRVNEQGKTELVSCYNHFNSLTTRDFMRAVLDRDWVKAETATTGEKVMVPIAWNSSKARFTEPDGKTFTTRRVLVEMEPHAFRLDTSKSFHTPFYTKVSTQEDKAKRAEVRKRIETLVDLACMRLPQMEQDAELNYRMGRPFSGVANTYRWRNCENLTNLSVPMETAMTEPVLASFIELAQDVYNTLASKRAYNEGGNYYALRTQSAVDLNNPVTEEDFRKSMMRFVLEQSGSNRRNGKQYLPMFAPESDWPRSGIFVE